MTKIISCVFAILCTSLFANQSIPSIVDFGAQEFNNQFFGEKLAPELVISKPFNGGNEIGTFFQYIKNAFHIDTVVETGTYIGGTTAFFGKLFQTVHTTEISPGLYSMANDSLKHYPNVHQHLGSSPDILKQILPGLSDKPVVFYLDAHGYSYWPLLDELEEISQTHKDNCIVVIDDIQVPGWPSIEYDSYNNAACSHEYVKGKLAKIYTKYTTHYLIPLHRNTRAKLVAIPTAWTRQ